MRQSPRAPVGSFGGPVGLRQPATGRRLAVVGVVIVLTLLVVVALLPPPASAAPGDSLWMKTWLPRPDFAKYGGMDLIRGPGGDLWLGAGGSTSAMSSPYVKRICVARYAPSGSRRWAKVLPSPVDMTFFWGLAVDRQRNAIVVGKRNQYDPARGYPWVITKLSPTGRPLWTRTLYSPVKSDYSLVRGVAVDSHGGIYAAGTMARATTGPDIVLIKYSATGAKKWTRFISGYADSADEGVDVAVDASDRVYVTGTVGGFFSGTDIALARYTTAGNQVWNRVWDGDSSDDAAADLAVSAAGVAVAGAQKAAGAAVKGVVIKATPAMPQGALLEEHVTTLSGKDVMWSSVALNVTGTIAAGGTVRAAPVTYFAYQRFRPAAPEPVALSAGPSGYACCYDVWLAPDSALLSTGVWNSSPTSGSSLYDIVVNSDVVAGTDWQNILVRADMQEGRSMLAAGSAVYVVGRSGDRVALWKFAR